MRIHHKIVPLRAPADQAINGKARLNGVKPRPRCECAAGVDQDRGVATLVMFEGALASSPRVDYYPMGDLICRS